MILQFPAWEHEDCRVSDPQLTASYPTGNMLQVMVESYMETSARHLGNGLWRTTWAVEDPFGSTRVVLKHLYLTRATSWPAAFDKHRVDAVVMEERTSHPQSLKSMHIAVLCRDGNGCGHLAR